MKQRIKLYIGADEIGKDLKDAIKEHLTELSATDSTLQLEVLDLGVKSKYYEVAYDVARKVGDAYIAQNFEKSHENTSEESRGILFCGTGMGMSVIANKHPGVYATPCETKETAFNARGINNSNVLTLGGIILQVDEAKTIVDTWLKTKFTSGWEDKADVKEFLEESMTEIPKILQAQEHIPYSTKPIMTNARKVDNFVAIPGLSDRCTWCVLRQEGATKDTLGRVRAIVRFPKGSIEPPHHHTHGHDVHVISGHKTVHNLDTNLEYELKPGQYLYTPAGQSHRVVYHEDTEYWFGSDEGFDMFWDTEQKQVQFTDEIK